MKYRLFKLRPLCDALFFAAILGLQVYRNTPLTWFDVALLPVIVYLGGIIAFNQGRKAGRA